MRVMSIAFSLGMVWSCIESSNEFAFEDKRSSEAKEIPRRLDAFQSLLLTLAPRSTPFFGRNVFHRSVSPMLSPTPMEAKDRALTETHVAGKRKQQKAKANEKDAAKQLRERRNTEWREVRGSQNRQMDEQSLAYIFDLLERRDEARSNMNFRKADSLKLELQKRGVGVSDHERVWFMGERARKKSQKSSNYKHRSRYQGRRAREEEGKENIAYMLELIKRRDEAFALGDMKAVDRFTSEIQKRRDGVRNEDRNQARHAKPNDVYGNDDAKLHRRAPDKKRSNDSEDERLHQLEELSKRLDGILGVVEAFQNGEISLPTSYRFLATNLAEDTHAWLSSEPTARELSLKVNYIDEVMHKEILPRIVWKSE